MTTTNVSQPATYRNAAILRPGAFVDANGQSVSFTAEDLQRIADNYDPEYHCAVLNLDHCESGPAQGYVADLVWDGQYLLASLAGVPAELAQQLSAGRYPYRSAEVYADLDGRGPYLRSLALLGARPPAVKGLPPLPEAVGAGHGPPAGGPWATPTNAVHLRRNALSTAHRPSQPLRIITVFTEVSMLAKERQQAAVLAEPASVGRASLPATLYTVPASPAGTGGVPPPTLPGGQGRLSSDAGSTAVSGCDSGFVTDDGQGRPPSQETISLAEENQRLAQDALRLGEENRALRAIQRQREVRYFLAELRGTGQLTPALERAGVEQALLAADEQPLSVTLPDGSAVPLSALLRELLKALPVSFTYGEAAPSAAPAAPALSADDQAVMAALGLSAEEYAVDSMR